MRKHMSETMANFGSKGSFLSPVKDMRQVKLQLQRTTFRKIY